jgi:hypothetical protein
VPLSSVPWPGPLDENRGLANPMSGGVPFFSRFSGVGSFSPRPGEFISYSAGMIFRTATALSGAGPSSPEMRHVVIMGSPT